jgi:hypothetical protein
MKTLGIFGFISGIFISIWAFLKFIVFQTYRLEDTISSEMIGYVVNAKHKLELEKEISTTEKKPTIYNAYCYTDGLFFFFSRSERLMTAGWKGAEILSTIMFFRFQGKKNGKVYFKFQKERI